MLHVFRAWLNLIVICSSGMAEPDSDDDALASMLAPVGGHTDVAANDADTDMPTVRLNRLEHMARVNAGEKARAGRRKATRIAQNTAECTDALDLFTRVFCQSSADSNPKPQSIKMKAAREECE